MTWWLKRPRKGPGLKREPGREALFAFLSYRDRKTEGIRTFSVLGGLYERQSHAEGVSHRFLYFLKMGSRP